MFLSYPEKTMVLIESLAEGLADDLREKRKGKLQRTFITASDAAESKVKRKLLLHFLAKC